MIHKFKDICIFCHGTTISLLSPDLAALGRGRGILVSATSCVEWRSWTVKVYPPLSYGVHSPPEGLRHPLMRTGSIFFKSYKNELVPLVLFLFFVKIKKKIIKAFFFFGLRGNFLHCYTLWFGCRLLNVFPYSVPQCSLSSFRLLNWIQSLYTPKRTSNLL